MVCLRIKSQLSRQLSHLQGRIVVSYLLAPVHKSKSSENTLIRCLSGFIRGFYNRFKWDITTGDEENCRIVQFCVWLWRFKLIWTERTLSK